MPPLPVQHSPDLRDQFPAKGEMGLSHMGWSRLVAGLGVAVALIPAAVPAGAQSAAEVCLSANEAISIGAPLPRTAARLKAGGLRMVAIGSSSTTGLWVLSLDATYPQVMRRELAALRPAAQIEVINSGRIGDTVSGSMARFQNDVLAYR